MARPPTVILDEPCSALREAVEAFARVFVFKPSRGFLSPPLAAAEELPAMLAAAGMVPPYVFSAASFGGFAALAYADRFPGTLAGLVLVDASHPEQSAWAAAAIPESEWRIPAVKAFKEYLQGFGPVWTESCPVIADIRQLGAVPLTVLAAGQPDMPVELSEATRRALTQGWHTLQRKHAALSARGELRLVPGVGHAIVRLAPGVIVAAIRELVERRAVT